MTVVQGLLGRVAHPLLMGVVNATTDSFSDGGRFPDLESRLGLVEELVAEGADLIDVGGQSAVTGVPELDVQVERDAAVSVIEAIAKRLPETVVSVDTYRPAVARAALEAGASIVNDISGLRDPELAGVAAEHGADLVVMHNRGVPKERLTDPYLYRNVVEDTMRFFDDRLRLVEELTGTVDNVVLDPGPDFSKTPFQTLVSLRAAAAYQSFGLPVLYPVSRKDFIGALSGRRPSERLGGTLATIGFLVDQGARLFRVHDVAQVRGYLTVQSALRGELEVDPGLELAPHLRREPEKGT
ncbi:MAG: folP [Frankiales bacterium]|nr:folP [Frankiales bacterium]